MQERARRGELSIQCVDAYRRKHGHTILPLSSLVFLQISPDDEHAVPFRFRRQFLQTTDARELLRTPSPRQHNVDLEAIANLFTWMRTR